jgi:hypothetical protein
METTYEFTKTRVQTDAMKSNFFMTKKDPFETPVKTVISPMIPQSSKAENI